MTTSQVVESRGSLLGLPTYPDDPEFTGLTALVTGANGISGYHMVRILAASPDRWSRIYCLSRRPPPPNFFEDLGDGASRVKHISVDFLSSPVEIAERLKAEIDKMNFLHGLKEAALQPKRFLLQTGAKHYGFHMGPATNPSFESDPRITLEDNFYYPQEDALERYCNDTGAAWNVVRPSYIIGAVRDSALNFMIGLAIFGAVESHLGRPLNFPGDYAAWDREYCQSTALLNAHFQEWVVLTDTAANQAFNIQDGQNFTWGRFWAYLATWYGTTWQPPADDESKYKQVRCRHKNTPRGYGPTGTTRSTFSFLEWSGRLEVQKVFGELAEKHGLVLEPFTEKNRAQIFGMVDSAVLGDWPLSLSMRKARKLGFFGTADSYRSCFQAMHNLARLKLVVPPMVKEYVE
ncbi:hypothetical protein N7478_011540 [Penicillium angulare]|uniref:uncharacterized protein n=1 Tax=Penicillium angulare TaxID=116970 RepID=UPI002541D6F6|nr:uncharacterized protein N7478_011540 [Penicillium angulare]KAJ5263935.1 hypothetical protein N7478_011540 [Penicillium angulare]